MNMRKGLGQVVVLAALVALVGCDRIGNPFVVLSSKPPAPDEFQVIARKPLVMPPTDALPEPRPGAPSPLDPDPNRDAELALLGTDVLPPGTAASQGEQALLSAADVAASNPEIRQALATDKQSGAGKPYEPPSIFELFGMTDTPPEDVIDPNAEARRLQSQGVAAAPINPSDRPAAAGETAAEQPSALPPLNIDRRPNNRPLSTVQPAYE